MAAFGASVAANSPRKLLGEAQTRAATLPDLVIEAQRIAATITMGWHGRRMRGPGENFWQFRPHANGESAQVIDWRRSARDDNSYVREMEWDAAHTVWLWADSSPSMQFKSNLAMQSKADRAFLIVLAVAELLSRSGERIAWPGIANPFAARDGATRLAMRLAASPAVDEMPAFDSVRRFNDLVITSDFSEPEEDVLARLDPLFKRGLTGHLIEVCDPVEEDFPYGGNTEFVDPETGARLTAGRAQTVASEYRAAFQTRRETLRREAARNGWSYRVSRTDKPATTTLLAIAQDFAVSKRLG